MKLNALVSAGLALGLFFSLGSLMAADFSVLCNLDLEKNAGCTIKLTGAISKGDAKKLTKVLARPVPAIGIYRTLLLDSPGGDVEEALQVAELVRRALLETSTFRVPLGGEDETQLGFYPCASACFLVWAAGTLREHSTSAEGPVVRDGKRLRGQPAGLGLHRPYFGTDDYKTSDISKLARKQQEVTALVREYLKREAIPEALIEEMMRRSSRDILWLENGTVRSREIPEIAPWFEELLIARCGHDPILEKRELDRREEALQQGPEIGMQYMKTDPQYRAYVESKRRTNTCLFSDLRRPAQKLFQSAGS